ncbi:MAG: DMT family transporter [Actinomycetota bacterium]
MRPRTLALLVVGVLGVSSSAILIRLAEAPPLAVSFYRNALAASVLLPIALGTRGPEIRSLSPRQWRLMAISGAILALHFALWVPSLELTSVAASTVLVTTGPVWVAIIGAATLSERIGRRAAIGIGCTLAGAVVISGGDLGTSGGALVGDFLALGGAIAAAGYVLVGRAVRPHVSLVVYVAIVYTVAAGVLVVAMLVAGTPFTGFTPKVWLLFALMAAGPQLMGHTVFNYLLAEVEAWVVAVAVTAEPVGASLLAFLVLDEAPPALAVAGGALILAGIALAISSQGRRPIEIAPE